MDARVEGQRVPGAQETFVRWGQVGMEKMGSYQVTMISSLPNESLQWDMWDICIQVELWQCGNWS